MSYRVIYLDPPWGFTNTSTRAAATNHYPTLTEEQIYALRIGDLALPNSGVFLWVPNSFMFSGMHAIQSWGFSFRQPLPWIKMKNGKLQMGLGNYFRNCSEMLLFGTKGRFPPKNRNIPNVIIAPRTRHSKKPEEAYDFIERYADGPYLEMFARNKHSGWDVWGDEVQSDIEFRVG